MYHSQDPLLIRFRNAMVEKSFVFEYVGKLNNMTINNIPSPYIPVIPGNAGFTGIDILFVAEGHLLH